MEDRNIDLGETRGISRKIDELGRITIPMEYRKELNINADDRQWLEMYLLDDGIFIKKKKIMYKGE